MKLKAKGGLPPYKPAVYNKPGNPAAYNKPKSQPKPFKPKPSGKLVGAPPVGAAPAPGAAPAAPAPPVGTPNDAGYASDLNSLQTRLANTNTQLAGQEQQVRQSYGFDPQFASDPYSRANLLARHANQRFNATTNGVAARGQLYSGSTNNARASDQFASDQEMNDARNQYAQALTDIENKRLNAQTDYTVGQNDAFQSLLGRLTASTPDPSLQSAPEYPSDYPTYSPKPKKKKGKK